MAPEENRGLAFQVQTVMGERRALLLNNDDYWPPSVEVGDAGSLSVQINHLPGEKAVYEGAFKIISTNHEASKIGSLRQKWWSKHACEGGQTSFMMG